jgi:hypothetical protein
MFVLYMLKDSLIKRKMEFEEIIKTLNDIQKSILDASKVYDTKMAVIWEKINKLKKDIKIV